MSNVNYRTYQPIGAPVDRQAYARTAGIPPAGVPVRSGIELTGEVPIIIRSKLPRAMSVIDEGGQYVEG